MVRDITALSRHSEIREPTALGLLKMKEAASVGGFLHCEPVAFEFASGPSCIFRGSKVPKSLAIKSGNGHSKSSPDGRGQLR